jgi:hypothetical protein
MARPIWAIQRENKLWRLLGENEIDEDTFFELKAQLLSDEEDWAAEMFSEMEEMK